jgi:hypothetical protein
MGMAHKLPPLITEFQLAKPIPIPAMPQRTKQSLFSPEGFAYTMMTAAALLVLAVIGVIAAMQGVIWNSGATAIFLALFMTLLWRDGSPPMAVLAIAAWAVALNSAGWVWNLFDRVWGFDEIAHALGTAAATLFTAFYVYQPLFSLWQRYVFSVSLAVFSLGMMLGAYWEVAEWVGTRLLATAPYDILEDVASDLTCDTVGALFANAIGYWSFTKDVGRRLAD